MKKNVRPCSLIRNLVRITILQSLFVCVGISLGYAHEARSQDLLDRPVTVKVENTEFKKVLSMVESQADVKFVYSSNTIKASRRISVSVSGKKLSEVLAIVLQPLNISYRIIGGQILLYSQIPNQRGDMNPENNESGQMQVKPDERTLTGKVMDASGSEALPGVNVIVKGTERGTSTNVDGTFTLTIPEGEATLVFSFVGYLSQEVVIGSQTHFEILLAPDTRTLNEVVVVAFGTQKKVTLTGSVASINTREIKQSPAANLAVTLAGRLPGLFAQQTSGEPGRDATLLFMRGRGTLNGSSPIILVDGVERELTSIDPNEVETVTILKDASSTALFGVRGANGVILVTTKRGVESTPTIGLSVETGMQAFTRRPSRLDSYEWAKLKNQAWQNDFPNPDANNVRPYSDYALERFRLQDDPERYPNNNWVDILLKKWVPQTRYNLTLNGKGSNIGYFVNVGFLNQNGQWNIDPSVTAYDPAQYMRRYNFRSNIDASLNKNKTLKTFLNVSGYLERVNGPFVEARFNNSTATTEIISRILNSFPSIIPGPLTPAGEALVGGGNYGESPWAEMNRSGYRRESRSNVTASWGLEQDFGFLTEGLSAKFMLSFDTRSIHSLNASQQYQYWVQLIDPNTQTADGRDSVYYQRTRTDFDNTPLSTSVSASFQSFYNMQYQVNYNRTFNGKHNFTGLILGTQQSLIKPADPLPFNVRGLATRLTYAFQGKYMAEFNAGYNGSEQFAKGRRYGFFPSISAGWNVHEEEFFKGISRTVNLLKFRGSYGTVGGDQLGDRRFLYLDEISRGSGSYSGTLGRGARIQESFYGNQNVQWEVAKKLNLGVELGLFNQISITTDFFKERRDNVLIYRGTIPLIIGVPSTSLAPANIGIVENKGFEIDLNYNKVVNPNLSIVSKVNFNHAKNKILYNDEVQLSEDFAYRYKSTGYQIGQQWGYKSLGFFNSQEEIDSYGVSYQGRTPRPGDLKFADLNGDKKINNKDAMPIGQSSVPQYNWGAAASITYKNLDISFLFQGAFKVSGQILSSEINDFRERHTHAWTPERVANGYEILYPALSLTSSSSLSSNSYFNENKAFVRLKNAEIGFTLPTTLTNRIGVKKLRLYVNGLNILTWDKMVQKDWDPELGSITSFPVYRVINGGINVNF
jgi:TonB-linked SusC/RagA family outer membrane protein